jgi:hypothetical protein
MSKLSEQQKQEILAAMNRKDEDIDFSDIPEIREIPADAIRGKDWKHYRGKTVVLTDEIHAYFAAVADRRQVSINDVVNDVLAKEIALVEAVK